MAVNRCTTLCVQHSLPPDQEVSVDPHAMVTALGSCLLWM